MCVTAIIVAFACIIIAICSTKVGESHEQFVEEDLPKFQITAYVLYSFLFIGLFISVLLLNHYMKAKNRMINALDVGGSNDSPAPGRDYEKCTIIAILMIFDLSYALKVFYDTNLILDNTNFSNFVIYMISLLSGLPFDIVPIILILVLHRRNFKKVENFDSS